ncbi:antibiotic biosynthesis monooxygenase [Actibacterium sp. 188UL27-1]|uniref:antibiotic biosynthesis monooxygenase family protein n=1 Tax=Actibacterium sp. 188UL27-1 TaxID=2786961 RepID=UPI001958C43B|nr:hypothetical protein [Actibacterium sp. 188UL27-1]MBM7070378.1 hypothetical protein [Actibacterium sp. 188UL27-1]
MSKNIIETVTFKLNDGVSREDFIAAARAMSPWVEARPGFLHRRLSCTEDGTWIEHIQWKDMDAAKSAAAEIGKAPGNSEFLSAINGPTVQLMHSELEVVIN